MKKLIIILLFALSSISGFSQQDAQYTQYMYNTININPAYAGTREVLSIFGLHRTQWVGLDGAPVTNTFSLKSKLIKSKLTIICIKSSSKKYFFILLKNGNTL